MVKKIIIAGLSIVLIVFVFFTGFFVRKDFLKASFMGLVSGLGNGVYRENLALKMENENLKAQIERTQILGSENKKEKLSARIFSTYPFNVKNTLAINLGAADGVKKGMAAVIGDNIFVGIVTEVSERSSAVRTVFDSAWEISVKIGEHKINGLFQGGNEPKLVLVEKPVKTGEPVFSSIKGIPFGLKIGEVDAVKEDAAGVFKEANVKIPYNINELEELNLIDYY